MSQTALAPERTEQADGTLLSVRNLVKEFDLTPGFIYRITGGKPRHLHAVDGISFDVREGTTLGLVGESGCGKSTTARLITRLIPATSGEIYFRDREVLSLSAGQFHPLRKSMQIVFQDPFSSL